MWLGLLAILMIGLIVVITPIWIIMPFKAQTQRGLDVSYLMRRFSPLLTIIASLIVHHHRGLAMERNSVVWQSVVGVAGDSVVRSDVDVATKSFRVDVSSACQRRIRARTGSKLRR